MPNLMLLFLLPFVTALLAFTARGFSFRNMKLAALVLSLLPLALLIYGHNSWLGTSVKYDWLPALSISFHLHVDATSLVFLYLTAIIIPVSLFPVCPEKLDFPNVFYGLVLLLQGLLIGFFAARDLALFTIFWEGMLLPLYFIMSLWGGSRRKKASLKFLTYMIAGSCLMIAAVLFLHFAALSSKGISTFNMDTLVHFSETAPHAAWICAIFLLAFSVKTPLFPFHAWLPDAYCEASTAGTVQLSAILSKAGIYGFFRIGFELFPTYMMAWSPLFLALAVAGVFYGGLTAWMQKDFKRLIAYSSLSHVNFILVGVFALSQTAHAGAILQSFNHGITIAALFIVAGWLEERLGNTHIGPVKGLAKFLPHLCWLTLFFVLSSVALPGTNNFVGELMILFGLFTQNPWLAAVVGLSIILSVIYMLFWMQKVYFEEPTFFQESWVDIRSKELLQSLPLMALILWVGLYPGPILKMLEPKVESAYAVAAEIEEPL